MRARSRQQEACWGWMMDRPYAGWRYAGQLFGPSGSYLPDDDKPMDWLYKARAVIGVAILVTVGIHYHQATQNIIAYFNPVLGGITEPMVLELLSVVPATVAAVLFTRQGKRDEAFRRMRLSLESSSYMPYCIRVHLGAVDLGGRNNPLHLRSGIIGGLIYLRFILFPFRAIYLITVGMCRLGDGHPLLPPIIGTALAWVVACQSLLTGSVGTGAHAYSCSRFCSAARCRSPCSATSKSPVSGDGTRMNSPSAMARCLPRRRPAAPPGTVRPGPPGPPTQPAGQPPYQRADWYQQASPYQRGAPYQRRDRPADQPSSRGTRAAIRPGPRAADGTRGLSPSSAPSCPALCLPPIPGTAFCSPRPPRSRRPCQGSKTASASSTGRTMP